MMGPKREPSTPPHRRDPFDGDFSDKRRAQAVTSDGARKRAARAFSNRGQRIPPAYFRREVEEFDRLRAESEARRRRARADGEGSSSGSASTSTELVALPPAEEYDAAAFGSSVAAEDFVPDEALEFITAQVLLRSALEAEEKKAQAAREEEIDNILLHQGLEADALAAEKKAYWAAYAREVVDLVSDEE